jgi:hypothetical protein
MTAQDSQPTPDILYPHWQNEYEAALVELDDEVLQERIDAAEAAIYRRLQQLSQDSNHHTERHVINDALASLASLRLLKRNRIPNQ